VALSFDRVSLPEIVGSEQLFPAATEKSTPLARAFLIKASKNSGDMFALDGVDPNDGWTLNAAGMSEYFVPTFCPETWIGLSYHSTRLKRCVEAMARQSVGLGANAYVPKGNKPRRNLDAAAERDRRELQLLLDAPNPRIPTQEVLYRVESDRQSGGFGCLEILELGNTAGGSILGLNHVRTTGVRIHKSRDLYLRTSPSGDSGSAKKTYFRRFGDPNPAHRYLDSEKGAFHPSWPASLPTSRQATALLLVDNYSPMDENYGQPTAVSALTAIVSNHMIAMWNINFLNNNASIPLAVIVEGGQLSTTSREYIEAYLRAEGKGIRNTGRALILEPDAKSALGGVQVKIRLEPLQLGVQEDASFLKLREFNDEEIREAFGLASIFLGKDNSAQSRSAGAARQVSQEQVVEPVTKLWEFVLNTNIAMRVGQGGAKVRITRPINMDMNAMAGVVYRMRDALSVNDMRHFSTMLMQLPEDLPEADDGLAGEFSNMPMGLMKLLAKDIFAGQNPPVEPEVVNEGDDNSA